MLSVSCQEMPGFRNGRENPETFYPESSPLGGSWETIHLLEIPLSKEDHCRTALPPAAQFFFFNCVFPSCMEMRLVSLAFCLLRSSHRHLQMVAKNNLMCAPFPAKLLLRHFLNRGLLFVIIMQPFWAKALCPVRVLPSPVSGGIMKTKMADILQSNSHNWCICMQSPNLHLLHFMCTTPQAFHTFWGSRWIKLGSEPLFTPVHGLGGLWMQEKIISIGIRFAKGEEKIQVCHPSMEKGRIPESFYRLTNAADPRKRQCQYSVCLERRERYGTWQELLRARWSCQFRVWLHADAEFSFVYTSALLVESCVSAYFEGGCPIQWLSLGNCTGAFLSRVDFSQRRVSPLFLMFWGSFMID